jgi:hypothetical protein
MPTIDERTRMNKVYRHKQLARDEYIGRVDQNGKVFRRRLGPGRMVGYVDLGSGNVFEKRLGPNKKIGRVDPQTGEVFLSKLGPDEYIGKVQRDGKCYYHKSLAKDDYIGKVIDMISLAHGGAGYLLLILPRIEHVKDLADQKAERKKTQEELDDNLDGLETA